MGSCSPQNGSRGQGGGSPGDNRHPLARHQVMEQGKTPPGLPAVPETPLVCHKVGMGIPGEIPWLAPAGAGDK